MPGHPAGKAPVTDAQKGGPWLMVPNPRTGRTEVYRDDPEVLVLVGSMPGDPSDGEIVEMMRRLVGDGA